MRVAPEGGGRSELAATRDHCHDSATGSRGLARGGGAQLVTSLGVSESVAPTCVGVALWGGAVVMRVCALPILPARWSTLAVALHASRSACSERRVLSLRVACSDAMHAIASATGPPALRVCVGVLVGYDHWHVGWNHCMLADFRQRYQLEDLSSHGARGWEEGSVLHV